MITKMKRTNLITSYQTEHNKHEKEYLTGGGVRGVTHWKKLASLIIIIIILLGELGSVTSAPKPL